MSNNTSEGNEWFKFLLSEFKEMRNDIKALDEKIQEQGKTLTENTAALNALNDRSSDIEETNKKLAETMTAFEQERMDKEAVKKYKQDTAMFVGKMFGGFAFIVGLVYSIFQLVDYLKTIGKS